MLAIKIRSQFIGFHRWKEAPQEVEFLRNFHRHLFNVEICLKIEHNQRNIEFFIIQKKINQFLTERYLNKFFELSCEAIAEEICNQFNAISVIVDEDGENGGICVSSMPNIQLMECKDNCNDDMEEIKRQFDKCFELIKSRNKKYGDSWRILNIPSLANLCEMKLHRISNMNTKNLDPKVLDEIMDVACYMIFGMIKINNKS